MQNISRPSKPALVLRTAALFFILYQFRLLAGDLGDTGVFIVTVITGFLVSFLLGRKSVAPILAVIIFLLIPPVARLLLAVPGLFSPGPAPFLDSLLVHFDRNLFVAVIPFYWASISSYFSCRSRTFLRGDIIASFTMLVVIYSIAKPGMVELYRLPVLKIGIFAAITILQVIALLFTIDPINKMKRTEAASGILAVLVLAVLGSIFLIGPTQEKAVNQGGGLLQPNLFKFDFSQILRLESEISLNNDLVMIVKKPRSDFHVLLRRFILSGYSNKNGFYLLEGLDDREHPPSLPNRPTNLGAEPQKNSSEVEQEYFLVNFDESAFIALNQPSEITPYQTWDASSFNSAYAVKSLAGDYYNFEIMDSVETYPDRSKLGLTEAEFAIYTDFGNNARIQQYARDLTRGADNYWDQVQIIYNELKYGDFRYSLKPGIASDGDQLGHFLFESKKGYCSYFAFSMTLMLRSLGIPSRVAVGFFYDPGLNTFDYYPVRSDMAHAWVEVRFPGYGWVEYDPTTTFLADGEEFRFGSGVEQDLFERLMKEILQNRSNLVAKEGAGEEEISVFAKLGRETKKILMKTWPVLLIAFFVVLHLIIRAGNLLLSFLYLNPRKKSIALWKHISRRIAFIGCSRKRDTPESEWAKACDTIYPFGLYAMYNAYSAARFSEHYSRQQHNAFRELYASFSSGYARTVSLWRRLLSWLCPYLLLVLPGRKKHTVIMTVFILSAALLLGRSGSAAAQELSLPGDPLLTGAISAEEAENWERAIEFYTRGIEEYPNDPRFPYLLGSLYERKKLYRLSWEEYRRTEKLTPYDTELLYRMSRVAALLNEDKTSSEYLERILQLDPKEERAIGDLAWMYYKLHRLNDGLKLLLSALDQFGPDYGYSMTLGTIYSDLFEYDESKKWYLDAIEGGEKSNSEVFTAVAHYNLSILESRFYQYANAMDRANESLRWVDRSSGRLARGELYLRRLDFSRVFSDYREAYDRDDSPLSKLSLAQAYQIAGRLEEARVYAEDTLSSNDLSWMVNFGMNTNRYKRDIHEILYDTYRGLGAAEKFKVYGSFREKLQSAAMRIIYSFKAGVNKHLYRKYSIVVADAYAGAEHPLDAYINYYSAFKGYPDRASKYLEAARNFEVRIIPESLPSYNAEDAVLFGRSGNITEIISSLDAVWERDIIAESYTVMAEKKGRGTRYESLDAAEKLFALNRGALLQNGIRLPVKLFIVDNSGGELSGGRSLNWKITSLINKSGFNVNPPDTETYTPRYRMTVTLYSTYASVVMEDAGRGISVLNRNIEIASSSAKDLSAFVRSVADLVFMVN